MVIHVSSKIKPPLAAGLHRPHTLADHLVGCWPLNEGVGQAVRDVGGHRYTGVFSGGPSWQIGPFGRVVEFDGVDDWISMGDYLDLGTDDVTLLAMVQYSAANQPDESGGHRFAALAGKGHLDSAGKGYGLYLYDNRITWQVRNQATVFEVSSNDVLNDGQWHTVVGVCDRDSSTGLRLYIDGVQQSATADPTGINGVNVNGSRAFAIGSRQEESGGTWWADFTGRVAMVTVWNRVLTESQIVELQRDPWALFARGRSAASFAIPAGTVIDLAGAAHGVSSAWATLQAIRNLSGVCAASASLVGVLRKTGPARRQDERPWRREAFFNGMTSNAFKLGTVLTQGWFWVHRSGCAAVYSGENIAQVDTNRILHVAQTEATETSLPARLSPEAGSTRCYLVRRFDSTGRQERTTTAAVMVRIGPDGHLAPPVPNSVFNLQGQQTGGRRLRLTWFYCPLGQEAVPREFDVYWDNGTGQIDLEHPIATIPYQGRRFCRYETEPLDDGRYAFVIRARGADHVEGLLSPMVVCPVTALSPEAATILSAQAI